MYKFLCVILMTVFMSSCTKTMYQKPMNEDDLLKKWLIKSAVDNHEDSKIPPHIDHGLIFEFYSSDDKSKHCTGNQPSYKLKMHNRKGTPKLEDIVFCFQGEFIIPTASHDYQVFMLSGIHPKLHEEAESNQVQEDNAAHFFDVFIYCDRFYQRKIFISYKEQNRFYSFWLFLVQMLQHNGDVHGEEIR